MAAAKNIHQPDKGLRLVPADALDRPPVALILRRVAIVDHHLARLRLGHLEFAELEWLGTDLVHRSFPGVPLRICVGAAHLEARVGTGRWNVHKLHPGLDCPHAPEDEACPDQSGDDRKRHDGPGDDRKRHDGPGDARDAALPIAASGAARGGYERGHLGRQPFAPAGAERQPLGEAQPGGQDEAALVTALCLAVARGLLYEPASQFEVARIGCDVVARPRSMGQQCLVREAQLGAVDDQQPRLRIEKRIDQGPAG